MSTPFVIWLTGLPKSGKTEIAALLIEKLSVNAPAELIDSSKIRKTPIGATLGFSRGDRESNIRRHALAAKLLNQNGVIAVVSAVSPYRDIRLAIRNEFTHFAEVHVATPVEVCIQRDTTGTYERAQAGDIPNYTGVSAPYEAPESPEVIVDAAKQSIDECVATIFQYITLHEWIEQSSDLVSETDAIANSLKLLGYTEED